MSEDSQLGPAIALVGMAGRFPGARTVGEFWRNVRDGVESVRRYSDAELLAAGVDERLLTLPNYVKAGATLEGTEMFDAGFFGFSPKDAAIMDPQHRHFLECAWEALEHAGYTPDGFGGAIGVYAGCGMNAYMMFNLIPNRDLMENVGLFLLRHTGNDKDFLATRVSYEMNLRGPSINVQTACSTSAVAIHMASQSLLNRECDMALAGGVTIELPHGRGYLYQEGEILARDGHCRAFDAEASGTVFGSGAGVVVLRRLEDALADGDTVYAVIRGSAVNNDGSGKVSYLAPSVDGQAAVIAEALAVAGVDAESISYVETHGTGTAVGDPIEVAALTQAFEWTTSGRQACAIGSVKTNIGHLDTAAGVASLIKTVQALRHRQLPPSLHFEKPNPLIDFASSPFYVNAQLRDWPAGPAPRRAGVSSLGVGGTNAHLILEEAPEQVTEPSSRPHQLLLLSAKTQKAADAAVENLAEHLGGAKEEFADICHTLRVGRAVFPFRRMAVCRDSADARSVLASKDPKRLLSAHATQTEPSIVFLFPGGGAQHPNMGRDLYRHEPVYRAEIDRCVAFMRSRWGLELERWLYPADDSLEMAALELEKPSLALPALLATEYALARLWMSWGIQPRALIGHSMGEYTAACLAGVFSLEDALSLVTVRGRLFETLPPGAMLSVPLPEKEILAMANGCLSVAAVNAPSLCVVAGETAHVEELERRLTASDVESRRVRISVAAHSSMLEPILEEFGKYVRTLRLEEPQIPLVSNVSGEWAEAAELQDPDYWVRQLRQTVRFSAGVGRLLELPHSLLLEVGPSQTLSSVARLHPGAADRVIASMPRAHETDDSYESVLGALGRIWLAGKKIDWPLFQSDERRRRVEAPAYPFEKQRHWFDAPRPLSAASVEPGSRAGGKKGNIAQWFYRPVWKKAPRAIEAVSESARWLVFADTEALSSLIIEKLKESGQEVFTVAAGAGFAKTGESSYAVDPDNRADYELLLDDLQERSLQPHKLLYMWTAAGGEHPVSLDNLAEREQRNFYRPLWLAQALGSHAFSHVVQAGFVTIGGQRVDPDDRVSPETALLAGPAKVLSMELADARAVIIDVNQIDAGTALGVIEELAEASAEPVVALRGGSRWIEHFEAAPLLSSNGFESKVRPLGVYLITGGLGGMATAIAEPLAGVGARLALVSRTPFPARAAWKGWLDQHDETDAVSRKIRTLMGLEAAGAEILVVSADVTNLEQMRDAVAAVKQKFGPIHGVIHAAGVLDDGLIALKTAEVAGRVLAPKVRGTLTLETALAGEPLDFFALCSSTSSILTPAGQVDYVSANAFLDAYASSRPGATAIDWGLWSDVGMMAEEPAVQSSQAPGQSGEPEHPLLGREVVRTSRQFVCEAEYRANELWVLKEHQIQGHTPVLPGTAYIEIARAALARYQPELAGVEIRDLVLLAPLQVKSGSAKTVRITIERARDGWSFELSSRDVGRAWQQHAQAQVMGCKGAAPTRSLDALKRKSNRRAMVFDETTRTRQEKHLALGPRWRNLKRVDLGAACALASFELPAAFQGDLKRYRVHPALLDMVFGFALPLLHGYETHEDFYVPVSFKSARFYRPLPGRLYAYAECPAPESRELATFDLTLLDEKGIVVGEIEGLAMRRASAELLATDQQSHGLLDLLRQGGILAVEGKEAFRRILSAGRAGQIVVCPLDLDRLKTEVKRTAAARPERRQALAGADRAGDGRVLPRNVVEENIAAVWRKTLGSEEIGVHDNFFDLGGHSLLAVRLFTEIKKVFGADLPLSTLHRAPTIAELAQLLHKSDAPPVQWPSLVRIQPNGRRPALFCVSGIGGSALLFQNLSRSLGLDQPLYALEPPAQGDEPPMSRVEDIAAHYIGEIRAVKPRGPYHLLGYSFGGLVTLEMAQRLTAEGEQAGMLAILDSFLHRYPGEDPNASPLRNRIERYRYHARQMFPDKQGFAYLRKMAHRKGGALRSEPAPPESEGASWPRSQAIRAMQGVAALSYWPKPYRGPISLFRASVRDPLDTEPYDMGWGRLAGGGMEVIEVPGDHSSIVGENVAVLANLLKAAVDRVQSADKLSELQPF